MRAPLKWALVLFAIALLVGQAAATTSYVFQYDPTIDDPSALLDVGTTPGWWGTDGPSRASLELVPYPVVLGGDSLYYGYGVASAWWVGDPENSTGWQWTDARPDYMSVWIKNQPNPVLWKELVVWFEPHAVTPPALWDMVTLQVPNATGGTDVVKPTDTAWNNDEGTAFMRWAISPQPEWELLTFWDSTHPECDIYVGFNCAPGLPAFALIGVAPVVGMFVRRRRG